MIWPKVMTLSIIIALIRSGVVKAYRMALGSFLNVMPVTQ
jgi:hypothetical protein